MADGGRPVTSERPTSASSDRHLDLRLARLHLRSGLIALARAELEAAAGLGILDGDGLADLAEARWRTGDLVGAGVAAEAHLAGGGDALVAFVIAAEARFAGGRRDEAEAAARAAVEAAGRAEAGAEAGAAREAGAAAALRAVFAGLPASSLWDEALAGAERRDGGGPPTSPRPEAAVTGAATGGIPAQRPQGTEPEATDWLAIADEAAAAGRLDVALAALGLALRREPGGAPAILAAVEGLEGPGVDLLRGDALRVLGRDAEAEEAYRAAEAGLRRPGGS